MTIPVDLRNEVNTSLVDYPEVVAGELTSAVFGPDTHTFAAIAEYEHSLFPEAEHLPAGNYAFWAVIGRGRVLHSMRLSFPTVRNGLLAPFQVHELIRSGQRTAKEFAEEYELRGHRLADLISAETHFRVESKDNYADSVALPSYLGLIAYCQRTHRSGVMGHLNDISLKQFRDSGFLVEPASTERDLYTPALDDPSVIDIEYRPCLMPIAGPTSAALEAFADFCPKHIETYLDLRTEPEDPPKNDANTGVSCS